MQDEAEWGCPCLSVGGIPAAIKLAFDPYGMAMLMNEVLVYNALLEVQGLHIPSLLASGKTREGFYLLALEFIEVGPILAHALPRMHDCCAAAMCQLPSLHQLQWRGHFT